MCCRPLSMKRVAIFGSPGSGKSTLARHLSDRTGIPVFHLDKHFFSPGWVIQSDEVFTAAIAGIVADEQWITDGNYTRESTIAGRFDRADTLILLEQPRLVCLWRVVRRILKNYGQVRADQAAGCPERLDWDFLRFVWNYPAKATQIRQLLCEQPADKIVLILRSNDDVKRFLESVAPVRKRAYTARHWPSSVDGRVQP